MSITFPNAAFKISSCRYMIKDSSMLPILLATGAALLFGFNVVVTRRGLNYLDAQTGSTITISSTLVLYILTAPFWMRQADWFAPGFWVFAGIGCLHPLISTYLAFEANRRIGPTISATFTATAPFFATLTAVLFLNESITPFVIIGTVCTVSGVITLSWNRQEVSGIVKSALIIASGAAVIRGTTHSLGRFGLQLMPNPFMAGFITFLVAFFGALAIYRLRAGHLIKPSRLHPRGLLLFIATGGIIGIAIWCMYGALSVGSVVVVSPIISAFPMFTMVTTLVFRLETISNRIVVGVCLVVAGVILISLGITH